MHQTLLGINCTIFAYGQTGSGKTYTMLGSEEEMEYMKENGAATPKWGIIPRAVQELFSVLRTQSGNGTVYTLHASYMQIYNDSIFDLLQDK